MMQVRNKIKREIAEEQCGCEGGNALHILPILIERAQKVQKEAYLCLIGFTNEIGSLVEQAISLVGKNFVLIFFCM